MNKRKSGIKPSKQKAIKITGRGVQPLLRQVYQAKQKIINPADVV